MILDIPCYVFKEIYSLGARRIGVLGAPPIGCVPSQRTIAGGVRRQCGEGHNQLATLFNAKLTTLLDSLYKDMPNSRMVYLDIYNPLLDLIEHPEKNGNSQILSHNFFFFFFLSLKYGMYTILDMAIYKTNYVSKMVYSKLVKGKLSHTH